MFEKMPFKYFNEVNFFFFIYVGTKENKENNKKGGE